MDAIGGAQSPNRGRLRPIHELKVWISEGLTQADFSLRGGILWCIGDLQEVLDQRILTWIILLGRLGALLLEDLQGPEVGHAEERPGEAAVAQDGPRAPKERERERGTTLQSHDCPEVRRAPGSWRPSLAPAAPYPSCQAGEGPVAHPPRGRARTKSGMKRTRGGAPSPSLIAPASRPNPASRGGDHPLSDWCSRLPRLPSGSARRTPCGPLWLAP